MIFYEYPLSERVRTYLRLERLHQRLGVLIPREEAVDHHYALLTLFEVLDVGARADLKGEILKDLERQKQVLSGYRGNPSISEEVLNQTTAQLEACFGDLNAIHGKPGQVLMDNEWLMGIRSRSAIPAGTCEFDLPAYHAWQHTSAKERRREIRQWAAHLDPLHKAVALLLRLLRESGVPQKLSALQGCFQQSLSQMRPAQLVRLALDPSSRVVPEISGHRLLVTLRFLRPGLDKGISAPLNSTCDPVPFELTLCA